MKRSEMLSYLIKIIGSSGALIGSSHVDEAALAEDVLSAVEELGMQPPNITKMPDTWFRSTGDYGYEVAEWEDE